MKFNVDKCSVMHCGRLNRNIDYKLYGQKISVTESEKDLEVIINEVYEVQGSSSIYS